MAAEEATCPECGKALVGKDRFEGKCAACREKEVLGAAPEPEPEEEEGEFPETLACPACGAATPTDRTTCAECGVRLVPPRVSLPRAAVVSVAGALVVAAIVLTVQVWGSGRPQRRRARAPIAPAPRPRLESHIAAPVPPAAPRPSKLIERVRLETQQLLALVKAGDHERLIDDYCRSDQAEFARVEALMDQIVRGKSADGLRRWTVFAITAARRELIGRLRRAGDPYPSYTADLLVRLTRDPQASGRSSSKEARARSVLKWHIAGLFGGLDLSNATIGEVKVHPGDTVTAEINCSGARAAPRPGDNPNHICWRALPVGLVVKTALVDRLRNVAEVLAKPIPTAQVPAP